MDRQTFDMFKSMIDEFMLTLNTNVGYWQKLIKNPENDHISGWVEGKYEAYDEMREKFRPISHLIKKSGEGDSPQSE